MTYADLAKRIAAMDPEQQNQDVTVQTPDDELLPVIDVGEADPTLEDRLDPGHAFLRTSL